MSDKKVQRSRALADQNVADEFVRQMTQGHPLMRDMPPIVVSSKAYHRWYCDCHSRDPQPAVPLEDK